MMNFERGLSIWFNNWEFTKFPDDDFIIVRYDGEEVNCIQDVDLDNYEKLEAMAHEYLKSEGVL